MSNRGRNASRGKKINPHYWVFCEGETEEAYVRHLRTEYRLPIEIVPKYRGPTSMPAISKNLNKAGRLIQKIKISCFMIQIYGKF